MCNQRILASVLFFAVVFWGESNTVENRNRIIGLIPESLEVVVELRTRNKIRTILQYDGRLLHGVFNSVRSTFSDRLVMPR